MAQRGPQRESVSCSCGHGYCAFCIKTWNLEQQRLRASYPDSEMELLIGSQPNTGGIQGLRDRVRSSKYVSELTVESLALHRSSVGSNSNLIEEAREPIQPDFSCREEFLLYSREITLDLDTAFPNLRLSEANKRVANVGRSQNYIEHPDRFNFFWQVLGRESLTGRCYWELEWTGPWVYVAVAYPTIQRYGNTRECGFGGNKQSWALRCRKSGYNFWHDAECAQVLGPAAPRVGVYLDHDAGALTFYSVEDETMTALHRVQTTFAQPLVAGLWMGVGATAVFCKLK